MQDKKEEEAWTANTAPLPRRPSTLARGPHTTRNPVKVKNKDLIVPVSSWYLTDMFGKD